MQQQGRILKIHPRCTGLGVGGRWSSWSLPFLRQGGVTSGLETPVRRTVHLYLNHVGPPERGRLRGGWAERPPWGFNRELTVQPAMICKRA